MLGGGDRTKNRGEGGGVCYPEIGGGIRRDSYARGGGESTGGGGIGGLRPFICI